MIKFEVQNELKNEIRNSELIKKWYFQGCEGIC